MSKRGKLLTVGGAVGAVATAAVAMAAIAPIKRYAVGIDGGYETTRLLSVGDTVPETSDPTKEFQMIGIPDGLGAHANADGTKTVYMNHELTSGTTSEPNVGRPLNRGAFVSEVIVDGSGNVRSGERAYDWIFDESTFHGPAPEVGNATRG